MMAIELMQVLLETTIAGSVAIVLVRLLRQPVRRWAGARFVVASWLLVPAAMIATLLPAREVTLQVSPAVGEVPTGAFVSTVVEGGQQGLFWLSCWLVGAALALLLMGLLQWRFVRRLGPLEADAEGHLRASSVAGLPAVLGVLRSRIVLPCDFEQRFAIRQRVLVLAHEQAHVQHRDVAVALMATLLRCVYWFNPLFHLAARWLRHDQELACDEAVLRRYPGQHRSYAETLLEAQLARLHAPVACHWNGYTQLKERIAMLKTNPRHRFHRAFGHMAIAGLLLGGAVSAWALQPASRTNAGTNGSTPVAEVSTPAPRYPVEAAEGGISGTVLLKVLVGVDGKVKQLVVERSQPEGIFDAASMEAARQWQFKPAMEHGKPVEGWVRVPVDFRVDPKPSGGSATNGNEQHAWSILELASTPELREVHCDTARIDPELAESRVECGNKLAGMAP